MPGIKKSWDFTSDVAPGKLLKIDAENIPDDFSLYAKKLLPSEAEQAAAVALANKIKKYQTELAKLKKQLAVTNKKPAINTTTLKLFSYIDKHCSSVVATVRSTKKVLYRGMDQDAPYFIGHPRKNRHPKDSSTSSQKQLDKLLSSLGFTALRQNSLFVTSNPNFAAQYGDIYVIFPKDPFTFTWSSEYDDVVIDELDLLGIDNFALLVNIEGAFAGYRNALNTFLSTNKLSPPLSSALSRALRQADIIADKIDHSLPHFSGKAIQNKYIDDYLKFCAYLNKAVPQLAQSSTLVPISKEISAILHRKKETTQSASAYLKGTPASVLARNLVTKHGFKNTNLEAAIKSGHEIYIHGEYIALRLSEFGSAITKYYLKPIVKKA